MDMSGTTHFMQSRHKGGQKAVDSKIIAVLHVHAVCRTWLPHASRGAAQHPEQVITLVHQLWQTNHKMWQPSSAAVLLHITSPASSQHSTALHTRARLHCSASMTCTQCRQLDTSACKRAACACCELCRVITARHSWTCVLCTCTHQQTQQAPKAPIPDAQVRVQYHFCNTS